MKKVIILIGIILILVIGIIVLNKNSYGLSGYAVKSSVIEEAYLFANEHPDALEGVNCYCGCMQHLHNGRIHKRGLHDSFMKEEGSYEEHASNCDMCINDALEVKKMYEKNITKEEIKKYIDQKYRK